METKQTTKMDYTPYIIGGVVLVGAAGVLMYAKKRARARAEEAAAQAEEQRKKIAAEQAAVVKKNVATTPTYTPYQLQVIALQTKIGVGADGNPGVSADSQTNKKVAEFYPATYAKYGNVTPANVTIYLAAKREEAAKGPSGPTNRLQEIWAAMGGGKPAILRKDQEFTALYYDSSKKVYVPTGGAFTVKAGASFYKSTSKLGNNGIVATATAYDRAGKKYTNKLLRVTPENLYVP